MDSFAREPGVRTEGGQEGAVSLNFVDPMIVLPVLAVALAGAGYLTLHPIVERRRAVRNDAAAHPDERGDA